MPQGSLTTLAAHRERIRNVAIEKRSMQSIAQFKSNKKSKHSEIHAEDTRNNSSDIGLKGNNEPISLIDDDSEIDKNEDIVVDGSSKKDKKEKKDKKDKKKKEKKDKKLKL